MLVQSIKMAEEDNGSLETWTSASVLYPYLKLTSLPTTKGKVALCASSAYDSTLYAWQVLSNGTCIAFGNSDSTISITLDLNGKNGPNVDGQDRFRLELVKSPSTIAYWYGNFRSSKPGLYFFGHGWTRETQLYDCKNQKYYACGELIFQNGWKVPKDYPY
jgi:hypothetical protein